MHIGTLIDIFFNYKLVGSDECGNKYYLAKRKDHEGKYKRCVIYNGKVEATKISPNWHGWIHYITDEIPNSTSKYSWQIDRDQNVTGTKLAYSPIENAENRKISADYQSWKPSS